jgi:hypothetical protein
MQPRHMRRSISMGYLVLFVWVPGIYMLLVDLNAMMESRIRCSCDRRHREPQTQYRYNRYHFMKPPLVSRNVE